MTRGNLRSPILGTIIELIFPVAFKKKNRIGTTGHNKT
jgi:hypothetical protein